MPKLDLQPPMPPLFPPLFFAKILNYVLKNMQKLDLQNCPASLPCQHFLNTSFSQRYIITCFKTYQNSTFKTGLPAPHASTFSTRLFRKDIQLRDLKNTKTRPPKLASHLPMPALFHSFSTPFFRRDTQLRAQKHAKTRPPKLANQLPMPALFEHVFFANIFNYVLKNVPKLDLPNCPASPPCQHFLNTSFSQRYRRINSKSC